MRNKFKGLAILSVFALAFIIAGSDVHPVVAQTEAKRYVLLGGEAFGIRMFSEGVIVIKVEEKLSGSNEPSPAFKAGIKEKDIIKSADGEKIYTNEQLSSIFSQSSQKEINLCIERDSKIINLSLRPTVDSDNNVRAGMWIKDSAAGIGTVTYYDSENSAFAALGHGIYETESEVLIPLSYGEIVQTQITDTEKSQNGKVGSLSGYFTDETIGEAEKNTEFGIFGKTQKEIRSEYIEIGTESEVNTGEAQIYCTVDGYNKKAYDIKIKRINLSNDKDMIIEITDPELLEITGGIVQGMSGSPIVQNGKLVGAVTHVLVNDVSTGYGVFIENMMSYSDNLS